jgi:hypothetical protein
MKTTIDISDDLLRRAKQAALERNTTLRAIIEAALERALGPTPAALPALRTLVWPPEGCAAPGLEPAVLRDALDSEREGHPDSAEHFMRRFGFIPPGLESRASPRK